jgi:hypothetical protein
MSKFLQFHISKVGEFFLLTQGTTRESQEFSAHAWCSSKQVHPIQLHRREVEAEDKTIHHLTKSTCKLVYPMNFEKYQKCQLCNHAPHRSQLMFSSILVVLFNI